MISEMTALHHASLDMMMNYRYNVKKVKTVVKKKKFEGSVIVVHY